MLVHHDPELQHVGLGRQPLRAQRLGVGMHPCCGCDSRQATSRPSSCGAPLSLTSAEKRLDVTVGHTRVMRKGQRLQHGWLAKDAASSAADSPVLPMRSASVARVAQLVQHEGPVVVRAHLQHRRARRGWSSRAVLRARCSHCAQTPASPCGTTRGSSSTGVWRGRAGR
jgi:hypothetical protein